MFYVLIYALIYILVYILSMFWSTFWSISCLHFVLFSVLYSMFWSTFWSMFYLCSMFWSMFYGLHSIFWFSVLVHILFMFWSTFCPTFHPTFYVLVYILVYVLCSGLCSVYVLVYVLCAGLCSTFWSMLYVLVYVLFWSMLYVLVYAHLCSGLHPGPLPLAWVFQTEQLWHQEKTTAECKLHFLFVYFLQQKAQTCSSSYLTFSCVLTTCPRASLKHRQTLCTRSAPLNPAWVRFPHRHCRKQCCLCQQPLHQSYCSSSQNYTGETCPGLLHTCAPSWELIPYPHPKLSSHAHCATHLSFRARLCILTNTSVSQAPEFILCSCLRNKGYFANIKH